MGNMIGNAQERLKTSTNALALVTIRVLTGLFLGLTFALIGDQIIDYGWFSFTLVIAVTTGTIFKVTRSWAWIHILIFNLICILTGLILRMYILIAPG
jgi:hypothetical protein